MKWDAIPYYVLLSFCIYLLFLSFNSHHYESSPPRPACRNRPHRCQRFSAAFKYVYAIKNERERDAINEVFNEYFSSSSAFKPGQM